MKKKRYITPQVEVETAWTQPLLTSSPLEEGLSRENVWGYDFDFDW